MTSVPTVKNEISIGTLVAVLGLVMTLVTTGMSVGNLQTEVAALKTAQSQMVTDSRALIRLQADMEYLKSAVDEIRSK
jgi:hypothetical protein